MVEQSDLVFADGRVRPSVSVETTEDLHEALAVLRIPRPRPTILLVGGAAGLSGSRSRGLAAVFEVLVTEAERASAVVLDGGTDAGVMRLMGRARAAGGSFPLVGVAASGTVILPATGRGAGTKRSALEPNHTHFLLVPGDDWGFEAPWLVAAAEVVAEQRPRLTVLVNGGEVAQRDVSLSVESGRKVVVVAGSGGFADAIVRARSGERSQPGSLAELVASPEIVIVPDTKSLQRELHRLSS